MRKSKYSSAPRAGEGRPVNRQAAIVTSAGWRRTAKIVEMSQLRLLKEDELLPIPDDGCVSLKLASRCRFIPKAVLFRGKRCWLEPMTWEQAFDVAVRMLDEWYGRSMQYIDRKYLGDVIPAGVELQWTYCYCLRHICKFLGIKYEEISFLAFVRN